MLDFIKSNIHNSDFRKFLNRKDLKKVVWTLDNHIHEFSHDQYVQKFFDRYYVAHQNFTSKLLPDNIKWLPCSFNMTGINELIKITQNPARKHFDIVCVYRYFPGHINLNNRNLIASDIYDTLRHYKNLKFCFCCTTYGVEYLNLLKSAHVVLNISMSGDFNIRNFECAGLNKIMLADKVFDHESVALDYSGSYFFNRDLSNFRATLDRALSNANNDVNTLPNVVNNHMLIHRFLHIINNELGCDYKLNKIDIQINENNTVFSRKEIVCTRYNYMTMSLRSLFVLLSNSYYLEAFNIIDKIIKSAKQESKLQGYEPEDVNRITALLGCQIDDRIDRQLFFIKNHIASKMKAYQ